MDICDAWWTLVTVCQMHDSSAFDDSLSTLSVISADVYYYYSLQLVNLRVRLMKRAAEPFACKT